MDEKRLEGLKKALKICAAGCKEDGCPYNDAALDSCNLGECRSCVSFMAEDVLEYMNEKQENEITRCPKCHQKNDPKSEYCLQCGYIFNKSLYFQKIERIYEAMKVGVDMKAMNIQIDADAAKEILPWLNRSIPRHVIPEQKLVHGRCPNCHKIVGIEHYCSMCGQLLVHKSKDCNTCGKEDCKDMPDPGERVKTNCPDWEPKE